MRQSEQLLVLYEISRILDETEDLKKILTPILQSLAEHTPVVRGAITLLNRNTDEILIESAVGLTDSQKKRGRYRIGEGITGSVVKTGTHVIIPDISSSSEYINKTGIEQSLLEENALLSFVSVPIKSGNETIGTLNIMCRNLVHAELELYFKLLSVIASMIARAVKIRQELREEKERLIAENDRLKQELRERFQPEHIIGNSQVMQELFDMIAQVSTSETDSQGPHQ